MAQAQLVIPESAVEKMKQTKAAYNFYIENIAVTVDAEAIAFMGGRDGSECQAAQYTEILRRF